LTGVGTGVAIGAKDDDKGKDNDRGIKAFFFTGAGFNLALICRSDFGINEILVTDSKVSSTLQ